MEAFFDLSKPFKPIQVARGKTDGQIKPLEEKNYIFESTSKNNCSDTYEYVDIERGKGLKPEQVMEADLIDGLTGMTSFEHLANMNELRAEETSEVFKRFDFQHNHGADLPILNYKERILTQIESCNVTIISGQTGCGKTTQVPQYVLDQCWETNKHCNIIVTQPRRIAAISIAQRVSEERNWPPGTLCGHQIGLEHNLSDDTRLLYCTVGVFLHKLINSKSLAEYTHIFLDEVHERSLELDFVLLIIRILLPQSNVKIILMSATILTDSFVEYFNSAMRTKITLTLTIPPVKKYNVNIFHLEDFDDKYLQPSVAPYNFKAEAPCFFSELTSVVAKYLSKFDQVEKNKGAVLVFLPGLAEIEFMHSALVQEAKQDSELHNWKIVHVHSNIPSNQQAIALQRVAPNVRKIILATNIAESSITVPDVEIVIDFCLTKQLRVDEMTGLSKLTLQWASQHNCIQRAGRVGRVAPGRVFRMVPKHFWNQFREESEPDIRCAPLEVVVLRSKLLNFGPPLTILAHALDPPPSYKIRQAILSLKQVGGLLFTCKGEYTDKDGDLTFLGRLMSKLPVDIHLTKLIALGYILDVLDEAIIIAAAMSGPLIFSFPFNKKLASYKSLISWSHGSRSDHMAALYAYEDYCKDYVDSKMRGPDDAGARTWAQSRYVELKAIRQMSILIDEIKSRLKSLTLEPLTGKHTRWNENERQVIIKFAIAGAFYPNYFVTPSRVADEKRDDELAIKTLGGRNPFTTVYLSKFPIYTCPYPQIYSYSIKKLLQDCTADPLIGFDGSSEKVYVEFRMPESNDENRYQIKKQISRRIPNAVYYSLFLRSIQSRLTLDMFTASYVKEVAKNLNLTPISDKSDHREHKFREPSNLPGITTRAININIIKVINPGHFMCLSDDPTVTCNKEQLFHDLEKYSHKPLKEPPILGATYLYCFKSSVYRVRIERINREGDIAQIFFIDTGKRHPNVKIKELLLPNKNCMGYVYKTPALVFECRLAEIEPAVTLADQREWSDKSREEFNNIIRTRELFGGVYSVVEGVVRIILEAVHKIKRNDVLKVNEYLIANKFAEPAKEGYYSLHNNKLRNTDYLDRAMIKIYDENQRPPYWPSNPQVIPPSGEYISRQVDLQGPKSPLEMKLNALVNRQVMLDVSVGRESVNCILLNEWPEDTRSIMVVSSAALQNQGNTRVNLKQTSVMPDIPGMASLMSIIFAPRVNYRLNIANTVLIGALCGLGLGPDGPIYPENDFYISFDVEYTLQDIEMVNALRHEMSTLLYTSPEVSFPCHSRVDFLSSLNRMKKCFSHLLATRPYQAPEPSETNKLQWDRDPLWKEKEWEFIYPRHRLPTFQNPSEANIELQNLLEMAAMQIPFSPGCCYLCNFRFSTYDILLTHLQTKEHQVLESSLWHRNKATKKSRA